MKKFNYLDEPLKLYLHRIAQKKPVPGGGSAVACAAAVCSALIDMVLNYTLGKEEYQRFRGELEEMKKENGLILEKFSRYIEEDSEVYENIRKYNRENPSSAQKYLKSSALLHLDICGEIIKIIRFAEFLAEKGNRNLISDTGIAAEFAVAVFHSAKLNVLINLKYINDDDFVKSAKEKMNIMEKQAVKTGEEVYNSVLRKLGG